MSKNAKAKTNLDHIELVNGVGHAGVVYGFDHQRKNFINWAIDGGQIVVRSIENEDDDSAPAVASLSDARAVAKRENALPNSRLRKAIEKGFDRD